tara:strand:- start:236 stop:1147 length:912 start_codon:yes stop_codon:yes gene_type:complete
MTTIYPFRKFYDSGRNLLKEEGSLKDKQLEGPWITYYKNGQIEYKGAYSLNRPVGKWEKFNDLGSLLSMVTYNEKGEEEGDYIRYYPNGIIETKGMIKDEQNHGHYQSNYKSGQTSQKGEFDHGSRVGKWEYFLESGVSVDKDFYFEYQLENSEDEEDVVSHQNEYLEVEANFLVEAGFYIFYADNDGDKSVKRYTSFKKELRAWELACGVARTENFKRQYYAEQDGRVFLYERVLKLSSNLARLGDKSMNYFTLHKIINFTSASDFISVLELKAFHQVAAWVGFKEEELEGIFKELKVKIEN